MKKIIIHILFSLLLFATASTNVDAQRGWEVGGLVGAGWYFGDLNTSYSLSSPGPAASLAARYNFNKRICVAGQLSYAWLHADDANSQNDYEKARNLHFRSHTFDASGVIEFNFMPYTHGSYDEPFTPYMLTGFALTRFSPQAELNGVWHDLRDLGTEGQAPGNEYFKVSGAWILGLGFKFDLNRTTSVNIEARMYRLFTDYLDDVSTVYADNGRIASRRGTIAAQLADPSFDNDEFPDIGTAGRQRGDANDNDVYATMKVGLMYYFGKVRCPSISRPY